MAMDGLRYAIRGMRGSRGVLAAAAATLALGIGGATAMFAVVDAVLLNPLPYRNGDRLVEVFVQESPTNRHPGLGAQAMDALRSQPAFVAVEAYRMGASTLTDGDPELVAAPLVTPGLLDALGAVPRAGRLLTRDDAISGDAVVVISERLWRTRFGGDAGVAGRQLAIEGQPHTIVGVLPAWFAFPERTADIWRPLRIEGGTGVHATGMAVAILAPGTSREAATAVLDAVSAGLRRDGALAAGSSLVFFDALQRRMGAQRRLELSLLLGAVLLVLLVACVNVAHLLLARVSAREGELAVMGALGAGRAQAFRVVLLESALVAAAGGLGGVLVARALLTTMLDSVPDNLKMVSAAVTGLDWRALAFAIAMSTLTCLAVAVLPVLRASRVDVIEALKGRGPGAAGGRHDWWHGAMVVTQLGLVVTLMIGAGLLLRSFARLMHVPPGFDTAGLAVTELQFARERYERGDALRLMGELRARIAAMPGVSGATLSDTAPPRGGSLAMNAKPQVEGQPTLAVERLVLPVQTVAPDYFATLKIPIVAGRTFEAADGEEAIVVNTVLARRFWGDRSPLGQRFRVDEGWPWMTVVGVAGDVKQTGLGDPTGEGMEAYQPLAVMRRPWTLTLTVRSASDPVVVIRRIRDEVKRLDPLLPVVEASSMEQRLVESVARPRFLLRLCAMFAIVAALVAAIGVYGATEYWVSRRRRELGVRVALGSTPGGVVRLVVGRGIRLASWACAIGLGATLLLSRAVRSLLFDTDPLEPAVLAATGLAVIGLVVIASLLPALRAGRVDPMRVLKSE